MTKGSDVLLIGVILLALILAVLVYLFCAVSNYTNYDKLIEDEEQLRYIEKWKKNHNVKDKINMRTVKEIISELK